MKADNMRRVLTAQAAAAYLRHLRVEERSAATLEKYTRELNAFLAALHGRAVDKDAVLSYKKRLIETYQPATVNAKLAAVNGLLAFLGWSDCRVKALKLQRRVFAAKERELSREEYEKLVAAAEAKGDRRLGLLLQLLAATGIRVSEVHAITLETVREGKAVLNLKGKVRTILLPGKLCRKLLKYAQKQSITAGELFLARSGRPLDRKEIWAQMKRLCRAAGVDPRKVFPHNFRHLFARVFYAAQKDIAKLADLLGHSSVETTRIYLLTSGEEHRHALDALRLVS